MNKAHSIGSFFRGVLIIPTKSPLFFKVAIATVVCQIILLPLYLLGLLYYNPLNTSTDIVCNYFFLLMLAALFNNVIPALIFLYFLYGAGVCLYYFTKRNLTVSDVVNFPELLSSFPVYAGALVILSILVARFFFYFTSVGGLAIGQTKSKLGTRIAVISFITLILGLSHFQPAIPMSVIRDRNVEHLNQGATWKHGGQVYSIYYNYIENRINYKTLGAYVPKVSDFNLAPPKLLRTPNVYVLLLESFTPIHSLNNEIIEKISRHVDVGSLLKFDYLGVSPTFGGYSAKAELEILCGVPELGMLGPLTFNYLGGKDAGLCLPSILNRVGYKSIAITGTRPHFHNAESAYASLGFNTFYHRRDHDLTDIDGFHPSDESIYKTAIRNMENQGAPKFFFVFTAAGHAPFMLNDERRPLLVTDIAEVDFVNRLLYSHIELTNFVNFLREHDPDSLIIALGDHNTLATAGVSSDARDRRMRLPVYISSGYGTQEKSWVLPFFNIPRVILSYISPDEKSGAEEIPTLFFRDEFELQDYLRGNEGDLIISNMNIIRKSSVDE